MIIYTLTFLLGMKGHAHTLWWHGWHVTTYMHTLNINTKLSKVAQNKFGDLCRQKCWSCSAYVANCLMFPFWSQRAVCSSSTTILDIVISHINIYNTCRLVLKHNLTNNDTANTDLVLRFTFTAMRQSCPVVKYYSRPHTKFFICTLPPCREIGSGHFH